jgi:hypothetical protein
MNPTKFFVFYCGKNLEMFSSVNECKEYIKKHPSFKTSYFTNKGRATSKNPNSKESFTITDNMGGMWYIK